MKKSINKFLSTALVVALGMLAVFPMTARAAAYNVGAEWELLRDLAKCASTTTDTITITSPITLSADLTIPAGTDITINGTQLPLINTNGKTITVDGGLTVANTGGTGIWVNGGAITVQSGGSLTVANTGGLGIEVTGGAITVASGGSLTVANTGSGNGIATDGVFTVASGGTLTVNSSNNGTSIVNQQGGLFNNYGTINKTQGLIRNESSTFNNYGTLNNGMTNNVASLSTFANQANSTFNNYGTINNNGLFNNNSPLNNYAGGKIDNNIGTFYNRFGTINNYAGGTIDNISGTFYNDFGTINNYVGGRLINITGGIINNIAAPISYSGNWNPPNPVTQEKPAPATTPTAFPAQGTAQKRLNAYVLDTLKGKVAFRVNKGEEFTLLGVADNGKALLIQKGELEGYIAVKDFMATFGAQLKATATAKKASVYTVQANGKLKRIGYYPLGTLIGINGVDGGYLISSQPGVTYYLKAGEWVLAKAPVARD